MNRKKFVLMAVLIVAALLLALSVSTVLAGAGPKVPLEEHAPVCYKVPYFVPGIYELQCYDAGKDIVNVMVKTELKYDLNWDNEVVSLIVYGERGKELIAYWTVCDKAGSEVSGSLP